jgi:hypothetical protein
MTTGMSLFYDDVFAAFVLLASQNIQNEAPMFYEVISP